MTPSRRNLIIIACLCALTIFLATAVRVRQVASTDGWDGKSLARYTSLQYAPYDLPDGPETSFYTDPGSPSSKSSPFTGKTPASEIRPVVQPSVGPVLSVTARGYIAGDMETGKIYLEKSAKNAMSVASMSKLITAFVATDTMKPDDEISITVEEAALSPDGSRLQAGEKFTLSEILYPLLMASSNVAAEAIASTVDRQAFLEAMSSYSWEVGMPSSYFADASGLDPRNAASARDLFALAQYLYKSRQDILAITRTPHSSIATTTDHGSHDFDSTHPFVNDPNFIGGKTGRTPEAGETMMTLIRVKGRPIGIIVLGSQFGAREGDTRVMRDTVEKLIN